MNVEHYIKKLKFNLILKKKIKERGVDVDYYITLKFLR